MANFRVFFWTDQIFVRQRYGFTLRGSSLENDRGNGAAVNKDLLYT